MATESDKRSLRSSPRFAVTMKCSIFYEDKLSPAMVQDLSDGGMLLQCSRDFKPGTIFGVHLNLSHGASVDCEVEVRNRSEMGIGVKIDYIDDKDRNLYQAYLQEFFSQQLNKSG
jgi:hypothetical protein